MADLDSLVESTIRNIKSCAVEVFNEIGAMETDFVYEACLKKELAYQHVPYLKISSIPFFYKGERIDEMDSVIHLLVENSVLVCIDSFIDLKKEGNDYILKQLEFTGLKHALIINFKVNDSSKLFSRVDLH